MKLFVSMFSIISMIVLLSAQSLAYVTYDWLGKGVPYEHLVGWTVIGYLLGVLSIVVSIVTRFKREGDDSFWALYWFLVFVSYSMCVGWSVFVLAMLAN